MQNIEVRFNASSNFAKVHADLASLNAEANLLGKTFQSNAFAQTPAIVDPGRWRASTDVVHKASRIYRDAASSSGQFVTQQIRATSETEKFTKALQKQKLSFGEMRKNSGIMKQVYQDQLRYQRMVAQNWGSDLSGRQVTDIAIPKNVPQDLDTMRRKLGMVGNMASSAGTQIVNMGKNIQWSGRQLTVGFTYPMALFGVAAGVMAYKVEDAFGSINKVYDYSSAALKDQNVLIKEQGELRSQSMEMATRVAKEYGLTVEKTLKVEQELAATGLKGKTLTGTTEQVQRFSALGDIDPEQTTAMVIALQNAFKGETGTAEKLANTLNYMNAASNATSLSLQDIAEATPRAAAAMAQMGVSAKDMTILLVSMREAGVNATEGANALKSASARILNSTITDKVTKLYKSFGANIDVGKMVDRSNGNFLEFIKLLGAAQRANSQLTAKQQAQAKASLFGTYQFSRLSAALKNIDDAQNGVNNQTSKAIALTNESNDSLAKQAKISETAMTSTPAAKFRKEWASLQITLSEVGKPFLDAAADILSAGSKIGEFFNKMPSWQKKVIGISAVVVGLAGPVVMLAGLFLNLFGQFVKGAGSILKFVGISKLVTKEEKAAALATEAQNNAMVKQTDTASVLTNEIRILTAAMEKANKVSMQLNSLSTEGSTAVATAANKGADAVVAAEAEKRAAIEKTLAEQIKANEMMLAKSTEAAKKGIYGQVATTPIVPQTAAPVGMMATGFRGESIYIKDVEATKKLQSAENARAAAAEKNRVIQTQMVDKKNAELAIQNKVKDSVSGTGIAMGVMGAAMAATLVSSNHVVDSIAKWAMVGTFAAPLLSGIGKLSSGMTGAIASFRTAQTGAAGVAGAMATARAGAVGFGAALNAALGPIGWIALGLTAVAGIFMAIKNHNDKMKAEQEALVNKQIEANKAMRDSTEAIAKNLGKAAGSWEQISNTSVGAMAGSTSGPNSTAMKSFNYYESEEGKKALGALDLSDESKVLDTVNEQFVRLQAVGNLTAKQSADTLKGMLLAAGMSYTDATDMIDDVYKRLGDISKMNWAKPIEDQINALKNAAGGQFFNPETLFTSGGASYVISDQDDAQIARVKEQATRSAEIFNQALQSVASPEEAKKIIDQYMNGALAQWQTGFEGLATATADGSDKIRSLFAEYGVRDGKTFAEAFNSNDEFKKKYEAMYNDMDMNAPLARQLEAAAKSGSMFESTVIKPLADSSWYLADGVTTANKALELFAENNIGLTASQATDNLLTQNEQYQKYADALREVNDLKRRRVPDDSPEMIRALTRLRGLSKATATEINKVNAAFGFSQGKTATQALNFLLGKTKKSADDAADGVDDINKKLAQMPTFKTVTIKLKQVGGIVQSAMTDVQSAMADSAMTQFNAGWDSQIASAQAAWDSRSNALQSSQEAASNKMENQQENAQDAFERRWEKRKDAVTKAYDQRIKMVQRSIKAEQDADAMRQRLFEKEKARLTALATKENTNIDFNTALNEGRLDDAAKTLNNAQASAANDQMDREQKAAEARTQAKIDVLEKKNDRLEKQRDKELKQLEKMEERMRKHLERVQDARRRALEKQQQQESNALEKSENAAMDSLDRQREYEEATLQQRLDLFKAYTARNKKDLEAWMKKLGFTYDDFGKNVEQKGESWAKSLQKSLTEHIRLAGVKVASDNMWENVGKSIGQKLLKGLGFDSLAQFNNFVKTGSKSGGGKKNKGGNEKPETRHEGGVIGSGGGSRGNIPNTYKGLHRSEKMIRAQKGEYMVKKTAAEKHGPLLDAINSGTDVKSGVGGLMGVGNTNFDTGYGNMAALMSGAMAHLYLEGIKKSFQNAYAVGKAKQKALSASGIFSGNAGTYGGTSFDAEQMKNAGIIASVGSKMGMSARDLEIGIMTSITESGLRNLHGGDRDSQGLFQQRPSQGWGTVAQVTDPQYAANKFFSVLRGVGNRASMSPWMAAQTVQRSAFSDGSNYQAWWDEAQAIFTKGLTKSKGGGYTADTGGGFISGSGGTHRPIDGPVTNGLHGGSSGGDPPAVDMAGPRGRKVYAVADGVITQSRDIAGPLASDSYDGDGPYGSFGRMMWLQTNGGAGVLYAHLNSRAVGAGTRVAGGSVIGYSGNTGNSSGPHLHFGATNGPYAWLRRGGKIRHDNTPVMAHKGETMLSERLTKRFENNVASGDGASYHVTLDLRGAYIKEDVDIEKAINTAIDKRENKVGRKRVVN